MAIGSIRRKYNNSNVIYITEQSIIIYTYTDTQQSIQNNTCQVVQETTIYRRDEKKYKSELQQIRTTKDAITKRS